LLDQVDEQPETKSIGAVNQQLPNKKIHALDVISLVIIARKCPENVPELFKSGPILLKILILREGPVKVSINLLSRLCFHLAGGQILKYYLALLKLLQNEEDLLRF